MAITLASMVCMADVIPASLVHTAANTMQAVLETVVFMDVVAPVALSMTTITAMGLSLLPAHFLVA